jgi:cytochrome c biogenesis protein CcmG/thiol:disulfide interchange protein DsbE
MLLEVQRGGRVPIIGLNWKDDDALAIEWLARFGNPYELVTVDHDGRAAIDWGVYGAPETFLVSADGIVVHKHVGPLTRAVWLRDFLPRLPPPAAAGQP